MLLFFSVHGGRAYIFYHTNYKLTKIDSSAKRQTVDTTPVILSAARYDHAPQLLCLFLLPSAFKLQPVTTLASVRCVPSNRRQRRVMKVDKTTTRRDEG